ncbi:MAG TPA: MFS transporter [Caulobacteraceae bacterium]|nr:MFS transporter [Caulobacteraceae bacterium]
MDDADPPVRRRAPARDLAAVSVGNALEFYDFVTFALFAIYIGKAFFPSHDAATSLLESLATFGAGFLTRPLGGMVLGTLGDRIGRKPALLICFALMGLGMAGIALTPDYSVIGPAAPAIAILCRLIQGFAVGGEVGPATAFMLEAAPRGRRALFVGIQGASQNLAILAASSIGLVLSLTLSPAQLQGFGWRLAFLLGVAIVPYGLWLRRRLPETLPARPGAASRTRVRNHARLLTVSFFVLTGGTMTTYVGAYTTTWAMDTLHMSPAVAFGRTVVATVITIVSVIVGSLLSDRYGRRPLMIWPTVAGLVLAPLVYLSITSHPTPLRLYAGTCLLAAVLPLTGGAFYAALAESLPPQIRSGAISILYALAIGIFGGSTQFVIRWLIKTTGDPMTPGWYLTGALAITLLASMAMRESAPVHRLEPVGALAPAG